MPLDRGCATDASLQRETRKKPVPPIEITKAYGPPVVWYDRLINPSMRCSTWRGNDLTKLSRQAQLLGLSEIQTADTPPVHDIIHRQRHNIFKNQPINNTLEWDPEDLLKFANIDTIKDALSFNPYSYTDW